MIQEQQRDQTTMTIKDPYGILDGEEAASGAAALDVGDATREKLQVLLCLIALLLADGAPARPQVVAQVHSMDRRTRALVQLSDYNIINTVITLELLI